MINLDSPPHDFASVVGAPSESFAMLLWHGIAPATRRSYTPAITSWEAFCALQGINPYPAQRTALGEWIAQRTFGTTAPHMGRLKPSTLRGYVAGIRSHHVDLGEPVTVFEDPLIRRLLDGAASLNPSLTRTRLPITRDILAKIITNKPTTSDINLDAAFTLAFAGFLRLGEVTYSKQEAQSKSFAATHATRSDISFSNNDDHMLLRLKRSKTDTSHVGSL